MDVRRRWSRPVFVSWGRIAGATGMPSATMLRMALPRWLKVVAVLVVVIVMVVAVMWSMQRKLIYFPDTQRPETPSGARDVVLHTEDGIDLDGWWWEPQGQVREAAVLIANGNAGHRGGRTILASKLSARGFHVLQFDYRGYGGNAGSPTQEGLYRDAEAAHDWVTGDADIAADSVLYFGESLGTGVVSHLATVRKPAGMLLRSPFVDLPAVGEHIYPGLPVRALMRDVYPVARNVREVSVPMVVAYGTADDIVPAQQSRDVINAAETSSQVEVVVVSGAGHNDLDLVAGDPVIDAFVRMADAAGLAAQ